MLFTMDTPYEENIINNENQLIKCTIWIVRAAKNGLDYETFTLKMASCQSINLTSYHEYLSDWSKSWLAVGLWGFNFFFSTVDQGHHKKFSIPVEIAIIIDGDVKWAASKPSIYLWCDHTKKSNKPIDAIAYTIDRRQNKISTNIEICKIKILVLIRQVSHLH